jgi:hypothetical protein
MPIAELVLDPIDAHYFPPLVAAATRGATIFHSAGWADADGCCEPDVPGKSS